MGKRKGYTSQNGTKQIVNSASAPIVSVRKCFMFFLAFC